MCAEVRHCFAFTHEVGVVDAFAPWRAVLCRPEVCIELKVVVALIDALRFAAELGRKPKNKAKVTAPIYTLLCLSTWAAGIASLANLRVPQQD